MVSLEIVRLTPERTDDYLYFFEHVAHSDYKEWDRCYCLDYCAADTLALENEFADANVRRDYAIKYIKEGLLQGYLAYANGQLIGWCNANDRANCTRCLGWKECVTEKQDIFDKNEKVKSVFCFTVAPHMRGKNVATALLERVIHDAKAEGYAYIEGYPNKGEADMYYSYVGPMGLYQKFGFEICGETEFKLIVRKKLCN